MASKKPFVNPLLRSSEKNLNLPEPPEQATAEPVASIPLTTINGKHSKGKAATFEETHVRFTGWVDKKLKKRFEDLVIDKGSSKTALLNEAITLLLHKQERKPYTRNPVNTD